MSPRFDPDLFRLIPSALMSLLVSGLATFRNSGLVDRFVGLWGNAWLPFWFFAFPALIAAAPLARRLVGMLDKVPAMQVQ